jgi:hypothetical protein
MYMVIVTGKVALIILWSIMSVFVSCVYEGPDRVYRLDSNYQMLGWPGWIMRYDPVYEVHTDPVRLESAVTGFAVLDQYIVGKTSDKWFAIDRLTHEIFSPHTSIADLEKACQATLPEFDLTTSKPWSRLLLSPATKCLVFMTPVFFVIVLIGPYRTLRLLARSTKGIIKKVRPRWRCQKN